ncbi:MAG TPA: hypothetical protein PKU94_07395 [Candidatus Hydrothermia bacterium]|nr:hypothetical protein [Candidatus Hydrothermia bacterium]HOP33182.1 hypothetical protein [Candidatus Hydrothermia bacterium]
MKRVALTAAVLLVLIGTAPAGTWVGLGNYIPSSDTTYGILSSLTPTVVAVRFGENILIEPTVTAIYDHVVNRTTDNVIDSFDVDYTHFGLDVKGYFPFMKAKDLVLYGFGGIGIYTETEKVTYQQDFGGIVRGDYDKGNAFGVRAPLGIALQYRISNFVSLGVDLESEIYYEKSSGEEKRSNTTTDLGSVSSTGIFLQNQVFRFMIFFGNN